jgi:hypothetical protein
MEDIRAAQLAEALQDPEFARLYAGRKLGLCMPHFRQVWLVEMAYETRRFLADAQHRQLEGLLGELDQYLHKHHWHVKEKTLPDEAESWRRAVAVLSGQAMSDAHGEIFGRGVAGEEHADGGESPREADGAATS